MVTNTVVVTLRSENKSNLESFTDFANVVLMKLQFEMDDVQQLIAEKQLYLVELPKFFKKLLFVSSTLELSAKIYSILKEGTKFYTLTYSLKDTIIEKDKECNYLKLPSDFSSKFLISPPHTPKYGDFNPLLLEDLPITAHKFNDELLKHGIQEDDSTIVLLNNSKSGVSITLTDCSDEDSDAITDTPDITQANSPMPPRSIFDDIDIA